MVGRVTQNVVVVMLLLLVKMSRDIPIVFDVPKKCSVCLKNVSTVFVGVCVCKVAALLS